MTRFTAALLLISIACAFAVVAQGTDKPKEDPKPPELAAARVEKGPGLDPAHEAWAGATETKVLAKAGHIGDTWVTLKAVHDGDSIYLLASWTDQTLSLNRNWQWGEDGWKKTEGSEDRITIIFNNGTPAFDKEGCDAMCHVDMLYTPGKGQKLDMWHVKAQRGGMHGFTDDQAIISLEDGGNPKGQKGRKSGRINDAGSAGYADNVDAAGKAPIRVWKDDADTAGKFEEATSREIPVDFKPKADYIVPLEWLRAAKGSRGDVSSYGHYKDKTWTFVVQRKLSTGNDDDAQFKPGTSVSFALAIFDNCGADVGNEHAKSGVAVLKLAE